MRRFWEKENKWYDGVVTDYKESNGQYCISYLLGTKNESFEWLNLFAPGQRDIVIEKGRVDLLKSFPKSRAGGPLRSLFCLISVLLVLR